MSQVKTKRMGEILLDAGLITQEKLELALSEQRQTGEKLGAALQRLGICTEQEISKVLAGQAGVDSVDLSSVDMERSAMDLVDRAFAEQRSILPLQQHGRSLQVAMANPMDLGTIDDLTRMTGKYIEVVHAPERDIHDALIRFLGLESGGGGGGKIPLLIEESQLALSTGVRVEEANSPFIRLVNEIIQEGVNIGATDLHIEPEEKVLRCRYRLDGHLIQGAVLPLELQSIVITRVKILADLDISENRVPQDGRIVFDTGRKKVDLRVSTFPTVHGEGVVCRVLDKENLIVGLERLGMPGQVLEDFRRDINRPNGIILVTGPTGSGKTTTLYSALTYLNKSDTKIITLEDPVEYELPVINQAQINTAKGFTFAKGLRAILRQDPDIILVGEIRDVETAQMAIRAALTGHLVFSTLHTNSAAGAFPRLLDMGVEPFLLSATVLAVMAQRLVRQVCPQCSQPFTPEASDLEYLNLDPADYADAPMQSGRGCSLCRQTGYRGRMAVFEYLRVSPEVRQMVVAGKDALAIEAAARNEGQAALRDDALEKFRQGKTSLEEVTKVMA